MPRASKIQAVQVQALELEGIAPETTTPKPVRKTRQRKTPAPKEPVPEVPQTPAPKEPVPEVPQTPEPAPEVPETPEPAPEVTPVTCEGFSDRFAALARSIPPSVRQKVLLGFSAKGIDPAAELDDIQVEQVKKTLDHAIEVYGRKRDRARILAASKRAAAKAAKAAAEAADKKNTDPEA